VCDAICPMRPALALLLCVLALAGCGGGGAAAPASQAPSDAQAKPDGDLPRPLAALREEQNELLQGGAEAFEARLDELEGHPVVVNKWASWCGPCRAEFPFFESQANERAGEVAFIGVNSGDYDGGAGDFLSEQPVPYPSYLDPELEVAQVFNGTAAWPTTAFYDSDGELAYVKQGGYSTEQALAEDIERYAR